MNVEITITTKVTNEVGKDLTEVSTSTSGSIGGNALYANEEILRLFNRDGSLLSRHMDQVVRGLV